METGIQAGCHPYTTTSLTSSVPSRDMAVLSPLILCTAHRISFLPASLFHWMTSSGWVWLADNLMPLRHVAGFVSDRWEDILVILDFLRNGYVCVHLRCHLA